MRHRLTEERTPEPKNNVYKSTIKEPKKDKYIDSNVIDKKNTGSQSGRKNEIETPIKNQHKFKRNYNAKYIAQAKQDKYVDNLFEDKKLSVGTFVEFGGLKGDEYSNTWYFEKAYNWSGIMIEAEKKFIPHLKKVRPNCKIYNNAVCPTGVKEVIFASSKLLGWSGILKSYEDPRWRTQVGKTFNIKCVDLNAVLQENNFNHVDYMTVDTEGSEIEILETFQFHRFDITYIQVERNVKTREQREKKDYLIQLMKKNGYYTKKIFDIGNNAVDILFEFIPHTPRLEVHHMKHRLTEERTPE
jgi:FkbM family methyltransferase